jgi:hypothetical protein
MITLPVVVVAEDLLAVEEEEIVVEMAGRVGRAGGVHIQKYVSTVAKST